MKGKKTFFIILISVLLLALAFLVVIQHLKNSNKNNGYSQGKSSSNTKLSSEKTASENSLDVNSSNNNSSKENSSNDHYTPENVKEPFIKNGIIIVNKKHPLPKSYNPGENPEARKNLNLLIQHMKKIKLNISNSVSGFRSYERQYSLYKKYVMTHGKKQADTFSARPGYSEHQTGLVFDLIDNDGQLLGSDSSSPSSKKAAIWLNNNAYKYGFIIRYKEHFTKETGYMKESWHIRYVGNKIAYEIYRKNISLEKYLGVSGGDYYSN